MQYKLSPYTARVVVNSRIYLYNSFTDHLLVLSSEIDMLLVKHVNQLDEIGVVHPDFFQALVQNRYIIPVDVEEWNEVLLTWEQEDNSSSKFSMIINPTLDCNMRCWYCYEQHDTSAYMSKETVCAIKELIKRKVSLPNLQGLNIDFFGGEPFLHYHKSIHPILEFAYDICEQQGVQLFVSFTTNGFLLSNSILDELGKFAKWGKIRMQITIDGNESYHNRTRTLKGKFPTYKKILQSIYHCVQRDIFVLVRFNYTQENISSYYDVIEDFVKLTAREREQITFTFHKVWQVPESDYLRQQVEQVRMAFKVEGFRVGSIEPFPGSRCYGDRENHIVINYNGDLYKCTAREFSLEAREGVLSADGELIWNDKYAKRMSLKRCPPICHSCCLFPVCHRGCTQNKIETSVALDKCLWGYTELQKRQILERKINIRLSH